LAYKTCAAGRIEALKKAGTRRPEFMVDDGRQVGVPPLYLRLNRPTIQMRRNIMTYVDGFVAAVPTTNREIYKKHAEAAAIVFKEHGALKLVECWGDDVPDGKVTSFPMAVKRKDNETVVFILDHLAFAQGAG
jgi:hypothetical protein